MSEDETNPKALKHLFNAALLRRLGNAIQKQYTEFDLRALTALSNELTNLEMKPRIYRIRDQLHELLPSDYPQALRILRKASEAPGLRGFDFWPLTEFVQTYGLEHPQISLEALKRWTCLFTSEWAIRPFIKKYPQATMSFLLECTRDQDASVRRWASEGTRPRLPWGERLQEFVKDPSPAFPILEALKFDPELFVRKSIANHLNDISKDHPQVAIHLLARWRKESPTEHAEKINWIIHRSLRTLIKDGNAAALKLIGVGGKADVRVHAMKLNKTKFKMGERLELQFSIHSKSRKIQKLVVDYIIHFAKAKQKSSPKVFKLKTFSLAADESVVIQKSHHFKPITTRKHYPGKHILEIQINGHVVQKLHFTVS